MRYSKTLGVLLVVGLLILISTTLIAQDYQDPVIDRIKKQRYLDRNLDCNDSDITSTTLGQRYCTNIRLQKADSTMRWLHSQMLDEYSKESEIATRIQAAQEAWIQYRNSQADVTSAKWEGGSGQAPAVLGELLILTEDRIKYLREIGDRD